METITGTVEYIKPDNSSVKMSDGEWYGCKFNKEYVSGVTAGDTVSFSMEQKGTWKNIKSKLTVTASGTPPAAGSGPRTASYSGGKTFPVAALAPERTINRCNAANVVAMCMQGQYTTIETLQMDMPALVALMHKVESYTTGDNEAEAVAKMKSIKIEEDE